MLVLEHGADIGEGATTDQPREDSSLGETSLLPAHLEEDRADTTYDTQSADDQVSVDPGLLTESPAEGSAEPGFQPEPVAEHQSRPDVGTTTELLQSPEADRDLASSAIGAAAARAATADSSGLEGGGQEVKTGTKDLEPARLGRLAVAAKQDGGPGLNEADGPAATNQAAHDDRDQPAGEAMPAADEAGSGDDDNGLPPQDRTLRGEGEGEEDLRRLAYAQAAEFKLPKDWQEGREPVSGLAIDASARDCDDMIRVERDGDIRRLTVSIADASQLVGYDAVLRYAEAKGESRYRSGNNVDPMLPPAVSEQQLSLLSGSEKPVLVLEAAIDGQGNVIDSGFSLGRGTPINVTYNEVARVIGGNAGTAEEAAGLREYYELAQSLIQQRANAGAFAFYDTERGIRTDEEGRVVAMPKGVGHPGQLIVQEAMIMFNTQLAQHMPEHGVPGIYRNHNMRQPIDVGDAVNTLVTGSADARAELMQALGQTFGRAEFGTEPTGHAALHVPGYAQGSSPLRRFGDTINVANTVEQLEHPDNPQYPFPADTLPGRSQHLNTVRQEVQSHALVAAEAADARAARAAIAGGYSELAALEPGDFDKAAKLASGLKELPPAFTAALEQRLQEPGAVTARSMGRLLFSRHAATESWEGVTDSLLEHLQANPQEAVSVLNYARQAQLAPTAVADARAEQREPQTRFTGVGAIASGEHRVSVEVTGAPSTAAARQAAAADALAAWVDRLPADSSRIYQLPAAASQEAATESGPAAPIVSGSPKNIVLEHCQPVANSRGVGVNEVADFDTKPSGGAFETILRIDDGGGPQSFTGHGSTKKAAEANAAAAAIQALRIPTERAPRAAASPVTTDPLMYLKEREDRGAPPAIYSRPRQRGDNWSVDVTVLGNDGRPRTVSGSARNIKAAKREAAQKAREILEE